MTTTPAQLDPRDPFLAPPAAELERVDGPHVGLSVVERVLSDLLGNVAAIGRVVILPGSIEVLRWDPVTGREVLTVHQVIR